MDARSRRDRPDDASIESRYRTILDSIDEGFCIIDVLFDEQDRPVDFRFLEMNSVFAGQTGLVDARNKLMRQLVPRHEQFWFDTYGSVARTGSPVRFEHHAAQLERTFAVFAFPVQGDSGNQVGVLFRDVSERKRREQELQHFRERLALAERATNSGMWEWDFGSGEIAWTNGLYLIFGLEPASGPVRPELWRPLIVPEDLPTVDSQVRECLQDGRMLYCRFRVIRPSGELRWIYTCANNIRNERGESIRMVGLSLDVTETHELTAAAAEAEAASRAKSTFMAMMSHELRTPLNAIIGFTTVLIEELPGKLNEEQHSQLAIVKRASVQLLGLVSEVLDLSHIEAGSLVLALEHVALAPLLREQIEQIAPAASSRGLRVFTEVVDESLVVNADRERLGQVLRNLLSNAVKFTDRGSVTLRARADGEFVTIVVEDTGIGIPADQIPRLFQPFQRVQSIAAAMRPGTGLGLSISKRLIEAMGGIVGIESETGHGTRIWCTVPRVSRSESDG